MSQSDLLIRAQAATDDGITTMVEPGAAGFEFLSMEARKLPAGSSFRGETGNRELGLVTLGGKCRVRAAGSDWTIGERATVFDGLPYTLYLPIGTSFSVEALTPCDLAFCYCRAETYHAPQLIAPGDVEIELRGGSNATRTIHHMVRPEFSAHRLLIVEVFTPSGNWSSYPPHKHDVHNPPHEVDLEEIYYYRVKRPEGYAIQQVYTRDRRLDERFVARDGDVVLIPEGYHPVVAGFGYDVYYLNVLAGSARSMAASDDPDHAWVRSAWPTRNTAVVSKAS
jgi:5-deoxy-glucuronate isomerase